MKFKIGDIVIRKNLRHDRGCVVVDTDKDLPNGWSRNGIIYLILDYDRVDTNGYVKTWVDESEIDIFISEVRNRKLKELGI